MVTIYAIVYAPTKLTKILYTEKFPLLHEMTEYNQKCFITIMRKDPPLRHFYVRNQEIRLNYF